jgi:RecA/RadA recombinase
MKASQAAEVSTRSALEALLVDLGSQVRRGVSQEAAEAPQALATGLPELDAQLGGGLPCGRLSEICGPPSSGRTALSFRLLAETLTRGVLAAWVDLADAFDPTSAADAGVDLERLLWVRPRRMEEAVRSTERLLQTEGFELVVFDLSHGLPGELPVPVRDVTWLRLARLAASTRTALVVLSRNSGTGSRSELVLEMQALGARFASPPDLLEALETTIVLQRHRTRPAGARVSISISALDFQSDFRSDFQTDPRTGRR